MAAKKKKTDEEIFLEMVEKNVDSSKQMQVFNSKIDSSLRCSKKKILDITPSFETYTRSKMERDQVYGTVSVWCSPANPSQIL